MPGNNEIYAQMKSFLNRKYEGSDITELTEQNASKWFGGDNRPDFSPGNVGTGQSIVLEKAFSLNSFSINFTHSFDYSYEPEGKGRKVV